MNRLGLFADSRCAIFKNNFCSAMKWRRARMTVDRIAETEAHVVETNGDILKRLVDRRGVAIKLTSERTRRFGRCAWSWWFHSGPISAMHPSVIWIDKENIMLLHCGVSSETFHRTDSKLSHNSDEKRFGE